MANREQTVMDLLCGELQTPWSYCDPSCTSCKFYHEDSDMGARVSICVYGFGNSKESCGCYMTQYEYLEFVRSVLTNLQSENTRLRERVDAAHMSRLLTENENEKLRELVHKMAKALGVNGYWCFASCAREFKCNHMDECPIAKKLAELGMEVD